MSDQTFGKFVYQCKRLLEEHPEFADLPIIAVTRHSPIDGAPIEFDTLIRSSLPEAGHWHRSDYSNESFQIWQELDRDEDINAVLITS